MLRFSSFDKFNKLYTRKQLFDRLTKYFISNSVKSILKNKILGIKAKKEEDGGEDAVEKEERDKKKKMLLGY